MVEKQVLSLAAGLEETATALSRRLIADADVSKALEELSEVLAGQAAALRDAAATSPGDVDERPFRVVLMGRTMSGKSTLFELLSAGDGARVGDGRQRYSRDSCLRPVRALGIEVVDTPGVGALDGQADFEAAFAEVPHADLIVWVAANDATQEQTGKALRILAAAGKPLLVVLNCRADLDDEIGWLDVTEEPQRVFDQSEGHLNVIQRHLARVGGRPVGTVLLHAQAALRASAGQHDEATSRLLYRNSRIDDLMQALAAERTQSAEARRLLRVGDQLRERCVETAVLFRHRSSAAHAEAQARSGLRQAFARRANRRIDDAETQLLAATTAVLRARAQWHDEVDLESDVAAQWRAEAELIQTELVEAVTRVAQRLNDDIQEIGADCADDWKHFTPDGVRDLTGFGDVWFNRVGRAGVDLVAVTATSLAGLRVGALVGSVVPGVGHIVGPAVGLVAGALAGLLLNPVKALATGLVDRLFRSKDAVLDRRRREVEAQMTDVLQKAEDAQVAMVADAVAQWRRQVSGEAARLEVGEVVLRDATHSLDRLAGTVREALGAIDAETVRALLGLAGRTRAASAVRRATRWPGVGVAVELPEPAFSELALFPVASATELLLPTPLAPGAWPSRSALHVTLGLHAGDVWVSQMTAQDLSVRVDGAIPDGIRQAWSDLALAHSGCAVTIDVPPHPRAPREDA
ncbi:GTPase [Geodermatophilus sp. SYSU D01106]